jgi:hypothetical protein
MTKHSVIDEEVIIEPQLIGDLTLSNKLTHDVIDTVMHTNILPSSFVSTYPVVINYKHGTIRVLAGSTVNYSTAGEINNTIRMFVSYIYQE